jgi:hypothetical protein
VDVEDETEEEPCRNKLLVLDGGGASLAALRAQLQEEHKVAILEAEAAVRDSMNQKHAKDKAAALAKITTQLLSEKEAALAKVVHVSLTQELNSRKRAEATLLTLQSEFAAEKAAMDRAQMELLHLLGEGLGVDKEKLNTEGGTAILAAVREHAVMLQLQALDLEQCQAERLVALEDMHAVEATVLKKHDEMELMASELFAAEGALRVAHHEKRALQMANEAHAAELFELQAEQRRILDHLDMEVPQQAEESVLAEGKYEEMTKPPHRKKKIGSLKKKIRAAAAFRFKKK